MPVVRLIFQPVKLGGFHLFQHSNLNRQFKKKVSCDLSRRFPEFSSGKDLSRSFYSDSLPSVGRSGGRGEGADSHRLETPKPAPSGLFPGSASGHGVPVAEEERMSRLFDK